MGLFHEDKVRAQSGEETFVLSTSTGLSVELVADNKEVASARLHQVGVFLRESVMPAIPSDILSSLGSVRIGLIITDSTSSPADGLFVPPGELDAKRPEIRLRAPLLAGPDWKSLVAHEFFHAIHYLLHPGEEAWVREGLAQLFEYQVLQRFNGVNLAAAFLEPTTPLMGEYSLDRLNPAQYGHNLLYFFYLQEQCGGANVGWKITRGEPGVFGSRGIEAVLRQSGSQKIQCGSFESSARFLEIARLHNRMNYSLAGNPKAYYLFASTLPGPAPRASVSETELARLPLYAPLLLEAATVPPLRGRAALSFERYWLQRKYPFAVQSEAPPASGSDWVQVIFKH